MKRIVPKVVLVLFTLGMLGVAWTRLDADPAESQPRPSPTKAERAKDADCAPNSQLMAADVDFGNSASVGFETPEEALDYLMSHSYSKGPRSKDFKKLQSTPREVHFSYPNASAVVAKLEQHEKWAVTDWQICQKQAKEWHS